MGGAERYFLKRCHIFITSKNMALNILLSFFMFHDSECFDFLRKSNNDERKRHKISHYLYRNIIVDITSLLCSQETQNLHIRDRLSFGNRIRNTTKTTKRLNILYRTQ